MYTRTTLYRGGGVSKFHDGTWSGAFEIIVETLTGLSQKFCDTVFLPVMYNMELSLWYRYYVPT